MADASTPDSAAPSTSSSPTSYGEGVDNADKTFNLLQSIDKFLGSPISNRIASNDRSSRLKRELGQWYEFLYDKHRDVYHNPVLSASKFRGFIFYQCNGSFRPEGKCLATASWAQLLHGLGITPEKDIISRRAIQGTPGDGQLTLEVEGEVICHVINLLTLDKRWKSYSGAKYETSIGDFVWQETSHEGDCTGLLASYSPLSEDEMNSPHRLFPNLRPAGDDSDTLLAKYRLALDLGTSDKSLLWPDPSPGLLADRFQKLRMLSDNLHRTRKPLFLSKAWKFGAERIVRRAAGGQHVADFLKDALQSLEQHKEGADRSSPDPWSGRLYWSEEDEKDLEQLYARAAGYIENILQESFSLQYAKELDVLQPFSPPKPDAAVELAFDAFDLALEKFNGQGSWRHELYQSKDMVLNILADKETLVQRASIMIVPLDSTTALWKEKSVQLSTASKVGALSLSLSYLGISS